MEWFRWISMVLHCDECHCHVRVVVGRRTGRSPVMSTAGCCHSLSFNHRCPRRHRRVLPQPPHPDKGATRNRRPRPRSITATEPDTHDVVSSGTSKMRMPARSRTQEPEEVKQQTGSQGVGLWDQVPAVSKQALKRKFGG